MSDMVPCPNSARCGHPQHRIGSLALAQCRNFVMSSSYLSTGPASRREHLRPVLNQDGFTTVPLSEQGIVSALQKVQRLREHWSVDDTVPVEEVVREESLIFGVAHTLRTCPPGSRVGCRRTGAMSEAVKEGPDLWRVRVVRDSHAAVESNADDQYVTDMLVDGEDPFVALAA